MPELQKKLNRFNALRLYCNRRGEYSRLVEAYATAWSSVGKVPAYELDGRLAAWIAQKKFELSQVYDLQNAPNPYLSKELLNE